MRWLFVLSMIVFAIAGVKPLHAEERKPNVLFLAIDDLNDWVGCMKGHPQALTPNIDRLAARGTLFVNAHCQAPLCNPSRSSLLSGLRPSTTGIHGLSPGIRAADTTKNAVTLTQTFTRAGYHTFIGGKIFHDGSLTPGDRMAEAVEWGPAPGMTKPPRRFAELPGKPHPLMDWGPFPATDEEAADFKIADGAITALKNAPKDKPFFIAVGFRLPHVPCFAPPKWFALFPEERVQLPPIQADDRDDTPRFSWYLHWKLPEPRLKTLAEQKQLRPFVRAYLASTAFMDAQIGRVLTALQESGQEANTLIVLWSDHGYHLGEKLITGKNTLWERSTRVPLLFAGPGIRAGAECKRPVELLDIYPTLTALVGLDAPKNLEGLSLVPLLKDPNAPRERPALTTHNQGNHAIRSERWRYIRYADGSEELYDMVQDPNEWRNLAADPNHAAIKSDLAKWLPKIDAPCVPGSAHRVLSYDPKTGAVFWEKKPIAPTDPIPYP